MFKVATLLSVLFFGLNGYSQNLFQKGYYLDNSNKKIKCLIENLDWLNNPTEFNYKLTDSSEIKTILLDSVKEFSIVNISKYVRHTVEIDRSSYIIDEMSYDKNPIFNKEQLFLKVLIEGKANLYSYEDKGLVRYFYNKDTADVTQLIFKNYINKDDKIATNNDFRGQLYYALKCESIPRNQFTKIEYKKSELIKIFIKYHQCVNSEFVSYQKKNKIKNQFNLSLRPGLRSTSLSVLSPSEYFNFGDNIGSFTFGVEAEFILPFNNNKWSILIEPSYKKLESDVTIISNHTTGEELSATINHESIELYFGLRHAFISNKNLKFFINLSLFYEYNLNSSIEVIRDHDEHGIPYASGELYEGGGVTLGGGFKLKERYSLELRYMPSRNIINSLGSWSSDYKSISAILGYTLF